MSWYYGWRPYVPVYQRRRQAEQAMAALRKKGVDVQPVILDSRTIARTFWGKAWCEHLEAFSDFENRLPRGRTYVRNGSVCHLAIHKGVIEARVSGSEIYTVRVKIKPIAAQKWKRIKARSAGQILSLLDLLAGRLSAGVMEVVTDPKEGLFPLPGEMSFSCSCPDWAIMCKHVAAVLYGVGARLDTKPELLFLLRGVDHQELISVEAEKAVVRATTQSKAKRVQAEDLGAVFGIDLEAQEEPASVGPQGKVPAKQRRASRPASTRSIANSRAKTRTRTKAKKDAAITASSPPEPAGPKSTAASNGQPKRTTTGRRAAKRK